MVVCCGIVGRGACIQSLLISVLLLVLAFPFLSSREFSGLTPQRGEHQLNFQVAAQCVDQFLNSALCYDGKRTDVR